MIDMTSNIELISKKDREVLRQVASRVAAIADREDQLARRQMWTTHNSLGAVPPPVFCDPENGWSEIIQGLECKGEFAMGWEWGLLREIFWGEQMRDDRVVTGEFSVGYTHSDSGWGMHERRIGGQSGGAYTWEAPLQDLDDLSGLHHPIVTIDSEATERMLELARDVFGDILKVRLHQTWLWSVGLTQTYVFLRGLEQMMLDMTENPDGVHGLMRFLRDGTAARIEQLEKLGVLHLNNGGDYIGSGGFGWTDELPADGFNGHVRVRDMWGMAESQETVGVSPGMFGEFVFPYQLELLSQFGLACYGCCEPVDKRWKYLSQIPNLRRVSVSPWCDTAAIAEDLQDNYILSLKPNPALLAHTEFDEDLLRKELREKLDAAAECRVEIIMKDCHTVRSDPYRVIRWVQIAKEERDRFWARRS